MRRRARPAAVAGSTFGVVEKPAGRGGGRRPGAGPRRPVPGRWSVAGAVVGMLLALPAFAPAAWLAQAVARTSEGRLLLADARGTVWSGDAVVALSAGPGARDAASLPGRLRWTLRWRDGAFELALNHPCCLQGTPRLRMRPGLDATSIVLAAEDGADGRIGHWPAAWLSGLGTPWNTLQLGGELRLSSQGMRLDRAGTAWRARGTMQLTLQGAASRLSTLSRLGSWRVDLVAPPGAPDAPDAADKPAGLQLTLATDEGPLRLEGRGSWSGRGLQLRGHASADPGSEAALAPLLDIIGRRQGDRSLIAIG